MNDSPALLDVELRNIPKFFQVEYSVNMGVVKSIVAPNMRLKLSKFPEKFGVSC